MSLPFALLMLSNLVSSYEFGVDGLLNKRLNWTESDKYCHSMNMSLVSIHSEEEFVALKAAINNTYIGHTKPFFIGLTHNGDYQNTDAYSWSDGSPFNYGTDVSGAQGPWRNDQATRRWEPDINVSACVRLNDKSKPIYSWDDVECSYLAVPICSEYTTYPTASTSTLAPTTASSTSSYPTTVVPTTVASTLNPTTTAPTTEYPTTANPTTFYPTTAIPTTDNATSIAPTTANPTNTGLVQLKAELIPITNNTLTAAVTEISTIETSAVAMSGSDLLDDNQSAMIIMLVMIGIGVCCLIIMVELLIVIKKKKPAKPPTPSAMEFEGQIFGDKGEDSQNMDNTEILEIQEDDEHDDVEPVKDDKDKGMDVEVAVNREYKRWKSEEMYFKDNALEDDAANLTKTPQEQMNILEVDDEPPRGYVFELARRERATIEGEINTADYIE